VEFLEIIVDSASTKLPNGFYSRRLILKAVFFLLHEEDRWYAAQPTQQGWLRAVNFLDILLVIKTLYKFTAFM